MTFGERLTFGRKRKTTKLSEKDRGYIFVNLDAMVRILKQSGLIKITGNESNIRHTG